MKKWVLMILGLLMMLVLAVPAVEIETKRYRT